MWNTKKKDENENKEKSKKFNIEAYEQLNNINIDELIIFDKKDRRNEIPDNLRSDFRKPRIIKINKDINYEIRFRECKRKKQKK